MRLNKLFVLMLLMSGCAAQQPKFVGIGSLDRQATATEYVDWYNKLVDKPQYDTVSAFVMPSFSSMRYVIVRVLNAGDVARVESKTGQFMYFLHEGNMLNSVVGWNEKGEIVKGLDAVMVSGCPLVIQYELCDTCKFNPKYKDEL